MIVYLKYVLISIIINLGYVFKDHPKGELKYMIKFIIYLNSFKFYQSINVWAFIIFTVSVNLVAMGNRLIKFNG